MLLGWRSFSSVLLASGALLSSSAATAFDFEASWGDGKILSGTVGVSPLEAAGGLSDTTADPGLDVVYVWNDGGTQRLSGQHGTPPFDPADWTPAVSITSGVLRDLSQHLARRTSGGNFGLIVVQQSVSPFLGDAFRIFSDGAGGFFLATLPDTIGVNHFAVDVGRSSANLQAFLYNADDFTIQMLTSTNDGGSFSPFAVIGDGTISDRIFGATTLSWGANENERVGCLLYETTAGVVSGREIDTAMASVITDTPIFSFTPPTTPDPINHQSTSERIDGECWSAWNGRGSLYLARWGGGSATVFAGPAMGEDGVAVFERNGIVYTVTPTLAVAVRRSDNDTSTGPAPPGAASGAAAAPGPTPTGVYLPLVLKSGSVILTELEFPSAVPALRPVALGVVVIALFAVGGFWLARANGEP